MKRGSVVAAFLDPGDWSASFGLSLVEWLLHDGQTKRRVVSPGYMRLFCSTGDLPTSRNKAARLFLDNTAADWLFMVDTDMGFPPDAVDELIRSADPFQRPVVGALCFANKRRGFAENHVTRYYICPTVYNFVDGDETGFLPVLDYPRGELVKVAGTGAACLVVHRSALVKLRERCGDAWFDPMTVKGTTFSEDLSFCMRLAACDVPLHVNTAVKTSHYKVGVYLDEHAYDTQPPIAAAEPAQTTSE